MSNHEETILRTLLADRTAFISGETFADKLGISRVAVWQNMEKLRAEGFAFEAVRNVGYRIAALPPAPHALLLKLLLALSANPTPRKPPPEIVVLDEVDSTNDEATRRLAAGCTTPLVVIARQQTKGRGRFGRVWHSAANGNLYASFAFHPRTAPARMQTFTLWMGANICDLIATHTRAVPGIKWPNDLLFGTRKAGGMLTEARIDADQIRDLVFGIGLNINSESAHWPAELRTIATSLVEQNDGTPLDTNTFIAALITRVLDAYEQLVENPDATATALTTLWKRHDLLHGKTITLIYGNERTTGTVSGIDAEGSLLLKTAPGTRIQKFRAGEVTIEKTEKLKS